MYESIKKIKNFPFLLFALLFYFRHYYFMQKKNILWIKTTDHTLQFWPKKSSEINLTQSSKPEEIKLRWKNKIKIPKPLKRDFLKQRGIIEAAITEHAKGFYQNRDNESFTFVTVSYKGSATIEYNGKKYNLSPKTIMIAPLGSSFTIKNRTKWDFFWLHLKSNFWQAYVGKELRIIKNSQYFEDIKNTVDSYVRNIFTSNRNEQILNSLAETLTLILKTELAKQYRNPIEKNILEHFKNLQSNAKLSIQTNKFAKKLKTSPYEINKISKSLVGKSFAKAQLDICLDIAINALQNGMNVRQASEIGGFPDQYTFSKIFKREKHISPSLY